MYLEFEFHFCRLMGVIDVCRGSTCLIKPQIKLTFGNLDRPNCCSFERNQKTSWVSCMASTVPLNDVKEEQQKHLTGDSFIRPHLRKLSPYQPILPFEVILF